MGKLTPLEVKAAREPGKTYADGGGLLLVVKPARREGGSPSRSWVLRIQVAGRRRDFGCGSADRVSLKEAREKAASIRKEYEAGLDPVAEKRKRHAPAVPTFKAAATQYHAENKGSWRNVKHRADWLSSLERYAYAKLGRETVDKITGGHDHRGAGADLAGAAGNGSPGQTEDRDCSRLVLLQRVPRHRGADARDPEGPAEAA